MTPVRTLIVALAAARATRFITTDTLGEWWLVGPAKRWAWRASAPVERHVALQEVFDRDLAAGKPQETPPARYGWQAKLVNGLDCPFCVGFWIGALILLGEAIAPRIPVVRHVWRFALAALALNYVVGHVSAKVDG